LGEETWHQYWRWWRVELSACSGGEPTEKGGCRGPQGVAGRAPLQIDTGTKDPTFLGTNLEKERSKKEKYGMKESVDFVNTPYKG